MKSLQKLAYLTENIPEFQLLESLLLNEGEWFLKNEHTNRLQNSAKYFGFRIDIEKVEKTLDECARNNSHGKLKVRLLLDKNGDMTDRGSTDYPTNGATNGDIG